MLLLETKMLDGGVFHRYVNGISAVEAVEREISEPMVDPSIVEGIYCHDDEFQVSAKLHDGHWEVVTADFREK